MDVLSTDFAATVTALSVLLGTVGTLWRDLRKKVGEVKEVANGNLRAALRRIDQLSYQLSNHGIPIPPPAKGDENL